MSKGKGRQAGRMLWFGACAVGGRLFGVAAGCSAGWVSCACTPRRRHLYRPRRCLPITRIRFYSPTYLNRGFLRHTCCTRTSLTPQHRQPRRPDPDVNDPNAVKRATAPNGYVSDLTEQCTNDLTDQSAGAVCSCRAYQASGASNSQAATLVADGVDWGNGFVGESAAPPVGGGGRQRAVRNGLVLRPVARGAKERHPRSKRAPLAHTPLRQLPRQ